MGGINNKSFRKYVLIFLSIFLIAGFSSCKKTSSKVNSIEFIERGLEPGEYIELEINDSSDVVLNHSPKNYNFTDKRVFILFGYDFNKEEVYAPIMEALKERYGTDDDNGLIYPVYYTASFKRGVRGYISELTEFLEDKDKDFAGVITLGAPENTHRALANHQDFWGMDVPYPVVAIYPQDDILGTESTCDIIIDNGKSKTEGLEEEDVSEHISVDEITLLLYDAIDYIIDVGCNFDRDTALKTHVKQMLDGRQFSYYIDPETGLASINHFVLY